MMENLNLPALVFALIGMVVLLISLFGNNGRKKTAKPVVLHTVPSIEQITMLKTHYGFGDEGARVMWSWIRSGKADEDSLAVDLFLQKIQGESLEGEVEGVKLSPEKLICSPRFKEELPEIKSFLHEVRSVAG